MEQVVLIKLSPEELKNIIIEAVHQALNGIKIEKDYPDRSATKILNLQTLCEVFHWKKATVYSWVHNSFIPHSKVGKRLYFNINEIEDWISKGRRKTIHEIEEEAEKYILLTGSFSRIRKKED